MVEGGAELEGYPPAYLVGRSGQRITSADATHM